MHGCRRRNDVNRKVICAANDSFGCTFTQSQKSLDSYHHSLASVPSNLQ